ncbi:MAG: phosphopantetheine-binding protein [bacterium]|nr:phosphopantetheine-binding protein [bacterium]
MTTDTLIETTEDTSTLATLQGLIAENTGYEANDILPSFTFEEDLGMDMEIDFPIIMNKINRHFNIRLNPREVAHEVTTIEQLVSLIEDEVDLG